MPFLFPRKQEVLAIHARLIETFGGSHGLRDEGALESALASAENCGYYENADLATCAATYAYHLTQAHAFVDGNKRIGEAVSVIFLQLNDARLRMTEVQIAQVFLDIAASRLSRDEVVQLFQQCVEFEN